MFTEFQKIFEPCYCLKILISKVSNKFRKRKEKAISTKINHNKAVDHEQLSFKIKKRIVERNKKEEAEEKQYGSFV